MDKRKSLVSGALHVAGEAAKFSIGLGLLGVTKLNEALRGAISNGSQAVKSASATVGGGLHDAKEATGHVAEAAEALIVEFGHSFQSQAGAPKEDAAVKKPEEEIAPVVASIAAVEKPRAKPALKAAVKSTTVAKKPVAAKAPVKAKPLASTKPVAPAKEPVAEIAKVEAEKVAADAKPEIVAKPAATKAPVKKVAAAKAATSKPAVAKSSASAAATKPATAKAPAKKPEVAKKSAAPRVRKPAAAKVAVPPAEEKAPPFDKLH